MFGIHLPNGFSAEISLSILETFLLGWGLLFVRHKPPGLFVGIVGAFVALVFLRPFTHIALTLSVIPAAIVCLAGFCIGRRVASERRFLLAFCFALLLAALLNTLASGFQWLGLEIYFPRLFFPSVEGPGGRTMGILGQSNHVGFLIVTAIFVMAEIWTRRSAVVRNMPIVRRWATHAAWLSLYLLLILGAASTRSRTALACAIIAAGFWVWTWRSRPIWVTATLAAFPALLLGAEGLMRWIWSVTQFVDLLTLQTASATAPGLKLLSTEHPRLGLWSHSLAIIAERPWFGWGWKQTRLGLLESFPDTPHFELFDNSHNLFLELAINFGIPVAVLAFVLICGLILKFRPWKEVRTDRITAWLILGCMLAYSQVEFPLWYLHFISLAALAAGYLWFNPDRPNATEPAPFALWQRTAVAAWMVLASAAAFIDYQWAARAYARSSIWPAEQPGLVTTEEILQSQRTVLFGPYTSYAIVQQPAGVRLTDQQIVYFGEYALSTAPEPPLLFKLIGAHQRLGNKERARQLAEQGLRQFPKSFKVSSSVQGQPSSKNHVVPSR